MLPKKSISITELFFKRMILVLILLGFTTLKAQQSNLISLKEALKIAKENNLNVLKSQLEIQLSEENIKESKELRLPDVEISGVYSRITNLTEFKGGFLKGKEVVHAIPEIYDIKTNFTMPIYAGNKINNAIEMAKQQSKIAEVQKEKTQNDVELEVVANYLGIYKLMQLQKIIDENIKEEHNRLKEVQSLKKHGTVTKNEVLRAELQLSDRELSALNNSKNIQILLHNFKTLLQLPEVQEISIDTTASIDENGMDPYDFYMRHALENEEMRIASQEINIRKTELNLVKGNYYPKINFFVGDDAVLVVFGTGNLTVTGHGKNHEAFTGFMIDETDTTHRPLIEECWQYLCRFTKQCNDYDHNRILREIPENCTFLDSSFNIVPHSMCKVQEGLNAALLYNDSQSGILQQISNCYFIY